MKKILLSVVVLASLMMGACSSDDDDDNKVSNVAYEETTLDQAPDWQIDWTNNQARPNWTEPDATQYENWTILMVQVEDELRPYVSEGDMIALSVNGEVRGLARPAISVSDGQLLNGIFLLKAYGNEVESETVNISLQFYNEKLQHLFTLSDYINLDTDVITGVDEDYIPEFTKGSSKYPVVKTLVVESILTKAGLSPVAGNMVVAFVGDECRGKAILAPSGNTPLVVYGRSAEEAVTLKYYDAASSRLYTINETVKM